MSLAIHGGPRAVTETVPPWPPVDQQIRHELIQLFDSGEWGLYQGEILGRLVNQACQKFGRTFAWPCSSGTIGVELALRGLGIRTGEVILAGYDFPGNFRAIESVGAFPVLVDVARSNWTIDPVSLERAVTPDTKAIIVSHLHGQLAPIQSICDVARANQVWVIEDACQVPGAQIDHQPVGSFGDVSVFSFGGSKLLTAGRGGLVLTNEESVLQRIRIFCERGNNAFPLSQLQAATILPQLEQLASRTLQRIEAVDYLAPRIAHLEHLSAPVGSPELPESVNGSLPTEIGDHSGQDVPSSYEAYYKFPLFAKSDREFVIQALNAEGIAAGEGFKGLIRRAPRRCRLHGPMTGCQLAIDQTVLLHHAFLLGGPKLLDQVAVGLEKIDRYLANQPK